MNRQTPQTPAHKWTKLLQYLREKDTQLVLSTRQIGLKPGSPGKMEEAVANAGAFAVLGQILARVEELEHGVERNTPVTQPSKKEEEY